MDTLLLKYQLYDVCAMTCPDCDMRQRRGMDSALGRIHHDAVSRSFKPAVRPMALPVLRCDSACGESGVIPAAHTCILPRLGLVAGALDDVLAALWERLRRARHANCLAVSENMSCDMTAAARVGINAEHKIITMLGVLYSVRLRVQSVCSMASIPRHLLPALHMTRVACSCLRYDAPACSIMLSDVAVHLGSIIMDSVIVSGSGIYPARSNEDAAFLIDQAKLTASFKIKKQYPKLAMPGLHVRCY